MVNTDVPRLRQGIFRAIVATFSAEPFLWAARRLMARAAALVKDLAVRKMLHAPGLHLGPGCVVRGAKCIRLGRNVTATRNLWLEAVVQYRDQRFTPTIEIGDGVAFSDGVHITGIEQIVIKKNVLMGSRIYISDHNHGKYKGPAQCSPEEPPVRRPLGGGGPVFIGENVWIGDNVVIVGPVTIGDGAVIGANSLVRQDVSPRTLVAGTPAKAIKRYDRNTESWERV
jgi:acetyltransferase-like isoleucine patch superfamily enzyme